MQRKITGILCATVMAVAAAVTILPAEAGSASDTIKERRALMKNNSGHVKGIFGFVKAGKGSAGDVARHAEAIAANAAKMSALFPAGTGMNDGVGETGAKPAIWSDRGKFDAAADKLGTLALALARTARSGDKKSIAMAMSSFGKQGCGGCHQAFRQKLKKK